MSKPSPGTGSVVKKIILLLHLRPRSGQRRGQVRPPGPVTVVRMREAA